MSDKTMTAPPEPAREGERQHAGGMLFQWDREDYDRLVASCAADEVHPLIMQYMPTDGLIVEAGCGMARWVHYLAERDYEVEGIEFNSDAVRAVQSISPGLRVIQGNVLDMPYASGSLRGIISLGVIEHFEGNVIAPLAEAMRVLAPGAPMVITVPSLNKVRQFKRSLYLHETGYYLNPVTILRRSNTIRRRFGREARDNPRIWNRHRGPYAIYPMIGEFFEYRFKPHEFENLLLEAGFEIIESTPIGHFDGVHHDLGRWMMPMRDWAFHPRLPGRLTDRLLRSVRFGHNHMHACVVRKPAS